MIQSSSLAPLLDLIGFLDRGANLRISGVDSEGVGALRQFREHEGIVRFPCDSDRSVGLSRCLVDCGTQGSVLLYWLRRRSSLRSLLQLRLAVLWVISPATCSR